MKCSIKGREMIKSFEALSLKAYHGKADRAEVWTIGWGHTRGVKPGDVITREKAEELFNADLEPVERTLNADLVTGRPRPLVTQDQFDALCSFVFNVGSGRYLDSTLRRKIRQGDIIGAAGEFKRWIYADHKIAPGLIPRRDAERRLFLQSGAADIAAMMLGVMLAGSAALVAMIFVM